jgi:hypothetical protein
MYILTLLVVEKKLPIIKESQIQIYVIVSIFVPTCIHSFRRCYARFGAYPNYIPITLLYKQLVNVQTKRKKKRKKNKKKAQIGTSVRARVFNAG